MRRRATVLTVVVAFLASAQQPLQDPDVLNYLEQLTGWYRDAAMLERAAGSSRETLYRDALRKNSSDALRAAFQFARAQAAFPSARNGAGAATDESRSRNLAQAEATAEKRIADLNTDIDDLNRKLAVAGGTARKNLLARRDRLVGELNLAKARREALHTLIGFLSSPESGGFLGRVNDLERSVPNTNAASATREPAQDFHPESAGIVGLTTRLFSASGKMARIRSLARDTEQLSRRAEQLRAPLRAALQATIRRGDAIAQMPDDASADDSIAARKELDDLLARFKRLSAMSAPLAQLMAQLNNVDSNLLQWRAVVAEEYGSAWRYLLLRLGILGLAILMIFLFSELWRRGTMRYVQDLRRRRQMLLLRRIVVGCTVALFVVLSFVTEFGSIATFAGFSAAGLALAMQSVLVSVVAYFFLVGRWGVRAGDRITVGGVTGEVIEIGLFRLYMMELNGEGPDLEATGRVVVFPNAVFFQPSAMYKQFPGINYGWRTMTMTLAPSSDYAAAERELVTAVDSVYAEYRESIERQHKAALTQHNFHTDVPRPESRVRAVAGGVEFAVRYPVELRRAGEIDDRVTRELMAVAARHAEWAATFPKRA